MISIDIPGFRRLDIEHLVLDVNGTIATGGVLVPGVAEALEALGGVANVVAVTADTHGTAPRLREALGIEVHIIEAGNESQSKLEFVRELGADKVAAVGNGANDALMLSEAALGIAVVGGEGASVAAMQAADIVTFSVLDALALLAQPARIVATLRR